MLARSGLAAGVEQHEAAGPIGVLGLAGRKAALPEEGRLLVACHAHDRDACRQPRVARLAKDAGAGAHLGHHRGGDAKEGEELLVPAALVDVVEHRATGVGGVGRVHQAAREHPDKPRVHRAKEQLARLRALARAGDVLQNPGDLAGREVRVGQKAGLGAHHLAHLLSPADPLDHICRAPALPHDGVAHGRARRRIPDDGGLALVVDADGGHVGRGEPVARDELRAAAQLREENLLRVVLDPAGLRENLLEGALDDVDHAAGAVDQRRARRRGPLVQRNDVLLCSHASVPSRPCRGAPRPRRARRP